MYPQGRHPVSNINYIDALCPAPQERVTFSTVELVILAHYCVAWRFSRAECPLFLLKLNNNALFWMSVNLLLKKKTVGGESVASFSLGLFRRSDPSVSCCWVLEAVPTECPNHRQAELEGAPGHFWQTAIQLRWNIISLKIGKHEMCYWHPWLYPWLVQNRNESKTWDLWTAVKWSRS